MEFRRRLTNLSSTSPHSISFPKVKLSAQRVHSTGMEDLTRSLDLYDDSRNVWSVVRITISVASSRARMALGLTDQVFSRIGFDLARLDVARRFSSQSAAPKVLGRALTRRIRALRRVCRVSSGIHTENSSIRNSNRNLE